MRGGQLAGWAALVAALLVAAGALLPIPPQFLYDQLDSAFAAMLQFGAAHESAAGTPLVSTFGPLGFVFYGQYSPDTFAWLVGIRVELAAATAWTLAWIGTAAAAGSPWGGALALLACAPFLAPPDVWFLTLPLLALLVELPADRTAPLPLRVALGFAIGVVCLIKFTFLLAALAVLIPLTAAALWARRMPPVALAAAIAAALGWLATGHGARDGLAYLDWSVREISPGYAQAMQHPADALLALHAAVVSLAVLIAGGMLARRRLQVGRWAALPALAGAMYLLFKAGFVRADVHVFITAFGLLVIGILLALLWDGRPARLAAALVLVALLPGSLWAHTVAVEGPPIMYFPPVYPADAIARLTAAPFLVGDALAQVHARRVAEIRAAAPLPALHGTVDVYSYGQAVALAHGLDLRPRPVFQSYMAYTPRLARANADVLLGPNAPEWILFRLESIDRRLPALDDAPSWPLLLSRYQLAGPAGAFALLQRRETPLAWRLVPLGRVETATGNIVEVPSAADGPIWARIDLHQTWRDAAITALVSAPLTYIGIALSDGQGRGYRLVPALARDGFLLSPLIEDTAGFMRLLAREPGPDHAGEAAGLIVQIGEGLGVANEPRAVGVEFFRLVVGG